MRLVNSDLENIIDVKPQSKGVPHKVCFELNNCSTCMDQTSTLMIEMN